MSTLNENAVSDRREAGVSSGAGKEGGGVLFIFHPNDRGSLIKQFQQAAPTSELSQSHVERIVRVLSSLYFLPLVDLLFSALVTKEIAERFIRCSYGEGVNGQLPDPPSESVVLTYFRYDYVWLVLSPSVEPPPRVVMSLLELYRIQVHQFPLTVEPAMLNSLPFLDSMMTSLIPECQTASNFCWLPVDSTPFTLLSLIGGVESLCQQILRFQFPSLSKRKIAAAKANAAKLKSTPSPNGFVLVPSPSPDGPRVSRVRRADSDVHLSFIPLPPLHYINVASFPAPKPCNLEWNRFASLALFHRPAVKDIAMLSRLYHVTHLITMLAEREKPRDIFQAVKNVANDNNGRISRGVEDDDGAPMMNSVWIPLEGANLPLLSNPATLSLLHQHLLQLKSIVVDSYHRSQQKRDSPDDEDVLFRPVSFVFHCAAGIHRTGTVSYALLRILGFTPLQCRMGLNRMRRETHDGVGDHRIDVVESILIPKFASSTNAAPS